MVLSVIMSLEGTQLTKKQTALLLFLYDFRSRFGESPTLAMVVAGQGLASNRSVIDMIKSLVAKGYLEPAAKVSRSTRLTEKALKELRLVDQSVSGANRLMPPFISSIRPITNAQSTWVTPQPSWPSEQQPSGTRVDTSLEDVTRQLRNAASSLLAYAGTNSKPASRGISTHPVVFFAISCSAVVMVFGSGVEAATLFGLIILITALRSIR